MDNRLFNPDGLVLSDNYAQTMKDIVLPALSARRGEITVEGEGGRPLYAARYDADAPVGTVLIVHGFTENADKFAELIYSLLQSGLSVVAYDQRGHGRSWRDPAIADLSLTHVDRFDAYVADMAAVYGAVVQAMPKPHRIFCHSMGGAVTALFLERHPGRFDRAAMCAPMIAPNLGMPAAVAGLVCGAATVLGRGRKRIFASRPYGGPEDFDTSCATGRARFDWYETLRGETPEFTNNGPSYGWTRAAAGVTRRILAKGAVERIDARVRLYTAARDTMVLPEPQARFIQRVKGGERATIEGAKHEIYRSEDAVLFPWWRDVLAFLKGTSKT